MVKNDLTFYFVLKSERFEFDTHTHDMLISQFCYDLQKKCYCVKPTVNTQNENKEINTQSVSLKI